MRATPFVFFVSMMFVPVALAAGCGSGSKTDNGDPNGNGNGNGGDSGKDIGNPASDSGGGTGGDSGGTATCTVGDGGIQASDDPACNACANSNCCKQITDCNNDPACVGFDECVGKCANDDEVCILTCADEFGPPDTVTAVGACADQKCKTVCSSGFDAGDQFDAL